MRQAASILKPCILLLQAMVLDTAIRQSNKPASQSQKKIILTWTTEFIWWVHLGLWFSLNVRAYRSNLRAFQTDRWHMNWVLLWFELIIHCQRWNSSFKGLFLCTVPMVRANSGTEMPSRPFIPQIRGTSPCPRGYLSTDMKPSNEISTAQGSRPIDAWTSLKLELSTSFWYTWILWDKLRTDY